MTVLGGIETIVIDSLLKLKEHIKGHYWDQSCDLDCATCGIKTIIESSEQDVEMLNNLPRGIMLFTPHISKNPNEWILSFTDPKHPNSLKQYYGNSPLEAIKAYYAGTSTGTDSIGSTGTTGSP